MKRNPEWQILRKAKAKDLLTELKAQVDPDVLEHLPDQIWSLAYIGIDRIIQERYASRDDKDSAVADGQILLDLAEVGRSAERMAPKEVLRATLFGLLSSPEFAASATDEDRVAIAKICKRDKVTALQEAIDYCHSIMGG